MSDQTLPKPNTAILWYPCNLVGYFRLFWLFATVGFIVFMQATGGEPSFWLRFWLAIGLIFPVLLLDILDGWLARRLNHTTKFGGVFELIIDLLSHTSVWVLSGMEIAPLFIAIEWTTGIFIAIFTFVPNDSWKVLLKEKGPLFVRLYYARPTGINILNNYANAAHFAYPIALFVFQEFTAINWLALPGLIIFELVSLYMIYTFVLQILIMEEPKQEETISETV